MVGGRNCTNLTSNNTCEPQAGQWRTMAFVENPLSLSVSQSAFETWLRENGHLEALDRRGVDQSQSAGQNAFAEFSKVVKANPFMSLTVEDLLKKPVPWTGEFFDCGLGPSETYSFPRSIAQTKLRMDANLRRYAGNYLVLIAIVFIIFLYKMPLALVGILSVVTVWDSLRRAGEDWGLERTSYRYRGLALLGNIVTVVLMVYCKIALALCGAGIASIGVVVVHSCLRRITPRTSEGPTLVSTARSPTHAPTQSKQQTKSATPSLSKQATKPPAQSK